MDRPGKRQQVFAIRLGPGQAAGALDSTTGDVFRLNREPFIDELGIKVFYCKGGFETGKNIGLYQMVSPGVIVFIE